MASWPTEVEWYQFRELRELVFRGIAYELTLDNHHKSTEGAMSVQFPHYFEETGYLESQMQDMWGINLYCYVFGPGRSYVWTARTLGGAVEKARKDIERWLREDGFEEDDN